jgi:hypothetical protein
MEGMGQALFMMLLEILAFYLTFSLIVFLLSYWFYRQYGKHALWFLLLAPISVFISERFLNLYGSAVWDTPIMLTVFLCIPILLGVAMGIRKRNYTNTHVRENGIWPEM